jgi:hypothetical protein
MNMQGSAYWISCKVDQVLDNLAGWKKTADTVVETLCEKIVIHWNTGDPADRLASQAGSQELLHLLIKSRSFNEGALERTRLYMDQHYRDTVTIESLAEMVGMSRYYFMSLVKDLGTNGSRSRFLEYTVRPDFLSLFC